MSRAIAVQVDNPFPGLRPFREVEEHLFFGRESQVNAIVDKLAAARFLAVVGTSGGGKSSLVNCGLRPALRRGLMTQAGTSWRMVQFRPGGRPLTALTSALAAEGALYCGYCGDIPLEELVDTPLRLSKRGLIDAFRRARLPEGVNLLVVVDQFEELFRYRLAGGPDQSQEAIALVNLLLEATSQTDFPIYVVLTMRSDFLGNCAELPGLPEAINHGQYLVPRLTREERRAAIKGPVGVGGAEISPVLLTRLVNDVGDNPDQLSILQHASNRTWAHWLHHGGEQGPAQGPIDLVNYEAIGTMAHALDLHAEKAYGELKSARLQLICQRVSKALTDRGTDPRGIRRPVRFADLCQIVDANETEVRDVLQVFRKPSRSFLVPDFMVTIGPDDVIDISHESFMRLWTRLSGWADEEVEAAREYRRLSDRAAGYKQKHFGLMQDPDLQSALDFEKRQQPTAAWAQLYGGGFEDARKFLRESEQERDKARAEREVERLWQRKWQPATLAVIVISFLVVVFWKADRFIPNDSLKFLRNAMALHPKKFWDQLGEVWGHGDILMDVLGHFAWTLLLVVAFAALCLGLLYLGRRIHHRLVQPAVLRAIQNPPSKAEQRTPAEVAAIAGGAYASWRQRGLALIIDCVVEFIVLFVLLTAVVAVRPASFEVLFCPLLILTSCCYHMLTVGSRWQATLGMRVARMYVAKADGSRVSRRRAFARQIVKLLLLGFAVYWPVIYGLTRWRSPHREFVQRKQWLGDLLSNTVVLTRPKKRAAETSSDKWQTPLPVAS